MAGLFLSAKSFLYPLLAFSAPLLPCTPSGKEIISQVRVVQKLTEHSKNVIPVATSSVTKKSKLTPTQAYLKVKSQLVARKWGKELDTYREIIDQCIAREELFQEDYYVFYHAQQSSYRILHDVINEIYGVLLLQPTCQDFFFMRLWSDSVDAITVEEFLAQEESHLSSWWSFADSHKMLCANLSLFGNSLSNVECTFYYFIKNRSWITPSFKEVLANLFDSLELNQKYINNLVALAGDVIPQEGGLLYQIFIPKDKVDKYVYLSDVGTAPWHYPINELFFNDQKQWHTCISPVLEQYCTHPESLDDIDQLQARILISKDFFLSPESGIKMFRYAAFDSQSETLYKEKLHTIIEQMLIEWIDTARLSQIKDTNFVHKMPFFMFMKGF